MADLNDLDASLAVKIAGASSSGAETFFVNANSSGAMLVDGSAVTQPISAVSLPLPTGAATETTLSAINGKLNSLGQKTMANSVPVAIASDQSAIPVSQSGTWNIATLTTLTSITNPVAVTQSGTWNLNNISGTISLPTGAATAANQSTEITSLQILDDVPSAQNGAFVKGSPAMGQLDDTSTVVATEDNVAVVRITAQRALHTNLRNVSGTEIGTSSNPIRVDPTGTTTQPVSMLDVAPANGSITAFDTGTSTLVGANGQTFYTGTPTTNSAAVFNLASIENVTVQANLLGAGGTMVVEVSYDGGTFWLRPNVFLISTQSYSNGFTAPFIATVNTMGATQLRVRGTVSWTGTATIIVKESVNTKGITIEDALPSGANVIGGVTQSGTWNINNVSGTVSLPTGASTAANQSTIISSIQILDDVPSAANAAFVKGTPIMGQLDDTSTVVATEDNVSVARITAQRALHVNLRNDSGTEIGTSNNPVNVVNTINSGNGVQGALTVGTSAVQVMVGGSPLAGRELVTLYNNSLVTIFWGYTSGVTTTNGTPLLIQQMMAWDCGPSQSIYAIAGTAGNNARVTEA